MEVGVRDRPRLAPNEGQAPFIPHWAETRDRLPLGLPTEIVECGIVEFGAGKWVCEVCECVCVRQDREDYGVSPSKVK